MSHCAVIYKMLFLVALSFLFSCEPEVLEEVAPETVDTTSPTIVVNEHAEKLAPLLGVNITWANDQRIKGDPDLVDGAIRHVRYFQMMEKDYDGATPATASLATCEDTDNPWSCDDRSMRQHLVRVLDLRKMFPQGMIWIAPEVLQGRGWPCKNWTAEELGDDPEQAGYDWGRAAFQTYGNVPGVIIAMTNEEWCGGAERVNAYNEWRRGIIRAHRENPSCELALGARHVRTRMWQGNRMPDNVGDVASDIWTYINGVGGWADYHAHGIEGGKFLAHNKAHTAGDYLDFFAWSSWLDDNYPNIRKSVGEIAYTTSEPGVVATAQQKIADWPTYSSLIAQLAVDADLVFMYQFEDHSRPEGAFSGSGVYPTLLPYIRTLGQQDRIVRD